MAKNDIIFSLKIKDMTNLGYGVSMHEGKTVFVKGGVREDILDAVIIKEAKNYSVAAVKRLITPSPYRAENRCGCYKACGGCVFRHVSYEEEKRVKYDYTVSVLKKYAGLDVKPEEIKTFSSDLYRNNVRYPVGVDEKGKLFPGFFSEKSHKIVRVENCLTQKSHFAPVIKRLFESLNEKHLTAYDEKSGKGYLRHACLRCSKAGKVAICLVVNGEINDDIKNVASSVAGRLGEVVSFSVNINKERTNVIFGNETITLFEKEKLTETVCGKTFVISPRSFFQINTEVAEMLYNKAAEYLELRSGEVLLDLYCGTGSVGICVAGTIVNPGGYNNSANDKLNAFDNNTDADAGVGINSDLNSIVHDGSGISANAENNAVTEADSADGICAVIETDSADGACAGVETDSADGICAGVETGIKLFGSEIVPEAVADANENAKQNNIADYTFVCGDASEGVKGCTEKYGAPDAITVDPPRKGLSPETVEAIISSRTKRLVYISCNPDTLARDLALLTRHNYTLTRIALYDLFPRTAHVETVVLITRAKE